MFLPLCLCIYYIYYESTTFLPSSSFGISIRNTATSSMCRISMAFQKFTFFVFSNMVTIEMMFCPILHWLPHWTTFSILDVSPLPPLSFIKCLISVQRGHIFLDNVIRHILPAITTGWCYTCIWWLWWLWWIYPHLHI